MRGRTPRWRWLGAGGGALVALTALVAALAWNTIFDSVLASQIALVPASRAFREWEVPNVPLYFDIYLFNWTNAANFPEQKPNMVQLGPYRFREERRHVNVTWHPDNASLTYRTLRSWHFEAASSNGTLDDNITTLNAIAASAIYRSRHWGFLRQKGLSVGLAMFGHHIAICKLARELLFEGYEDPLLDLAKSLPSSATGGVPSIDRFGWFYQRNNSIETDGVMEVSTGQAKGSLPGQILKWNHEDHLPFYSGECSTLSGTTGEFMPRNLTEQSTLTMFAPDLCRTVNMRHVASGTLDGLAYHKYALDESAFDNSTSSSSNTCFCDGECLWGGVMNVSACRFGSPAFISLPHFLHAEPRLRNLTTGLHPDPDKHSFYFSVEPKLGIPIEVAARFQLNIYLEPSPNIALYENVPRMLFPILWVEQRVRMVESVTRELRAVRGVRDWGGVVCACAALAAAALAAAALCTRRAPAKRPHLDRPTDEAEIKLNPI